MAKNPDKLFPITDAIRLQAEKQLTTHQRAVDFDIKEFTVELLCNKFLGNDLIIPEYQRKDVWKLEKKSRFIESVLMGLPIPYMFGAELQNTGEIEVVDGAQRLYTVTGFLNGDFRLTELEQLSFLSDFCFTDLSMSQQRRFKNRTLRMVVLSEKADNSTRFDIFERINTGSELLTASELRRGAFPGPFYDLVEECAGLSEFRSICPLSTALRSRREPEELVLRFFAYSERYRDFKHDVARFLNEYLVEKNSTQVGEEKRSEFDTMLAFVGEHFPNGFAKTRKGKSTPRVRFEAISVGVHLALQENPGLTAGSMTWLDSEEFLAYTTTHASNSRPRLRGRIEFVRDSILGVIA